MRVLVTGAAGRIGSAVFKHLAAAGHQVTGTDLRPADGYEIRVVDLLDHAAVRDLVAGHEAIVHLANNPSPYPKDPVRAFRDNVGINIHLFHAAAEAKVKKVVFASSVHAFNGRSWIRAATGQPDHPSAVPYLPADGDYPANPGNEYGLGKVISEQMLAYYARWEGIQGITVRLPSTMSSHRKTLRDWEPVDELFSYLELSDAARLFEAIIRADLPGHRIYFPSGKNVARAPNIGAVLDRFYRHVPRRQDLSNATSLVDNSRITAETGWSPEH